MIHRRARGVRRDFSQPRTRRTQSQSIDTAEKRRERGFLNHFTTESTENTERKKRSFQGGFVGANLRLRPFAPPVSHDNKEKVDSPPPGAARSVRSGRPGGGLALPVAARGRPAPPGDGPPLFQLAHPLGFRGAGERLAAQRASHPPNGTCSSPGRPSGQSGLFWLRLFISIRYF